MKVILSESVPNVGEMGATVDVSSGFARNYLLPRRLAVLAESGSARQIEHEMRIIKKREEKRKAALREQAAQLEALTVEIKARAGEDDKLFGSVTNANIADRLKELGTEIDRRNIVLDEPIKALGIFVVPVRMGSGVEANLKVWVTKEADEEEVAKAEE